MDTSSKFRFNMRLTNSDFALFTDLSSINKQPAPLFAPSGADASKGGTLTLATQNLAPEGTAFAAFELPGSIFMVPASWPVQFTLDFRLRGRIMDRDRSRNSLRINILSVTGFVSDICARNLG